MSTALRKYLLNLLDNHVIEVYSGNKLHDYTTAYRHQKSSGEMLGPVGNLYLSLNLVSSDEYF